MVFVTGCASSQGLHADQLQAILEQEESRFAGPSPTPGSPPSRSSSPTLGLYLNPTGFLNREFDWTTRDRDTILAWSKELQLSDKSASFVSQSSLKGNNLTELRQSATRYGVDWLLVFDGAAAVDRYNNYKAGLLYWTLLGAYFAEGTHSDALCVMKATLWDVKTGARLFTHQSEGATKKVGPAALVDDREEIERARKLALDNLLQWLTEQFAALTATRR